MKSETEKQNSQKISNEGNPEISVSQTSWDQSHMTLGNNSKATYKQMQVYVTEIGTVNVVGINISKVYVVAIMK